MGLARYVSTCPATAVASGTACYGAGGANQLTAVNQPWLGAAYRIRGDGLAPYSLAVVVTGLSGLNTSLATVLPSTQFACLLLASPDIVTISFPANGSCESQLDLPYAPALAGLALHQQYVLVEFDGNLNFIQHTSTNAVVGTLGIF